MFLVGGVEDFGRLRTAHSFAFIAFAIAGYCQLKIVRQLATQVSSLLAAHDEQQRTAPDA